VSTRQTNVWLRPDEKVASRRLKSIGATGTRWNRVLLLADAKEYERQELSRRAEPRRSADASATFVCAVRLKPDTTCR
jgi:hypothetical protein